MSRRRHLIADRRIEITAGAILFVAGSWLLRDAFEGRGKPVPLVLRPFSWW